MASSLKSNSASGGSVPDARFSEPIAIVGMSGVFPGAQSLEDFWLLVEQGRDMCRTVTPGRWILDPASVRSATPGLMDSVFTTRGGFCEDFVPDFSASTLPPHLSRALDPMFHMLIHAGKSAFASAKTTHLDRSRIGVIVGNIALPTSGASKLADEILSPLFEARLMGRGDERPRAISSPLDRYVTGLPAGILARALGLGGGAFTLDAACASSLYAIKLACDELLSNRADAMLAGGLSRPDSLYTHMGFSQLRALSPSGRCSPFDQKGDGLIVGEGSGVVMLKRLETAREHGDSIAAVIRGVGLSNDIEGNLLSPSSEGQLRALRGAYSQARWTPDMVDLIECHATGTPVGDAVEFESLCRLWEDRRGRCVLSAVKSNIGHLLTAAGSAGLIRTILAMNRGIFPPVANFERPSTAVKLAGSPFTILSRSEAWNRRVGDIPRRAAISGFGFGGINAHLLIEEWLPDRQPARSARQRVPEAGLPTEPVAIVGLATRIGPWTSLQTFQERVLRGDSNVPSPRDLWRGLSGPEISQAWKGGAPLFPGFYVEDFSVPIDRFHISPRELSEMLPQQLLMLDAAKSAIADAQIEKVDSSRTGVFIGLGLDMRTTDFHFRWATIRRERERQQDGLLQKGDETSSAWLSEVREGSGPPLTADRTLGALGGVVASRVAREFGIGGPAHTLCSEDTSGLRAVEVAVRALQNRELDLALAGAVDLAGDVRTLLATDLVNPYSKSGFARPFDHAADGTIPGEGAACVVLKRLSDAERDGDRVYAVVRGVGAASDPNAGTSCPAPATVQLAFSRAYNEAGVSPETVSYLETHGSGSPNEDRSEAAAIVEFFGGGNRRTFLQLGSAKADVGHTGAVSGLASLIKASLCLHHETIPGLRGCREPLALLAQFENIQIPHASKHWVRDRILGPRRAGVSSMGIDGNCVHLVLEACEKPDSREAQTRPITRTRPGSEALFLASAADHDSLRDTLTALVSMASPARNMPIAELAHRWWHSPFSRGKGPWRTALLARDTYDLPRLAGMVGAAIQRGTQGGVESEERQRVFVSKPSANQDLGELAFVFPGSGNQFPDMGREFALEWPRILQVQDAENERLASQMFTDCFWRPSLSDALASDYRAMICGQVSFGTMMSDLALSFGLKPRASIGYSLGESTALFAFRAWRQRDEMWARLQKSPLFSRDLAGHPSVLRAVWGLAEDALAEWTAGVIDRSAEEARAAIGTQSQVYILIVNTPDECVLGGNRTVVESVVKRLGGHWFPLRGVSTVHCELARSVRGPYREMHRFKTIPPAGIDFYSGAWGRVYPLDQETAADAIEAQALETIDFPRLIRAAHNSGIRSFIEIGPGNSCSRMIGKILADRPHFAKSLAVQTPEPIAHFLRTLAGAFVEGSPLDLDFLYPGIPAIGGTADIESVKPVKTVTVSLSGAPFVVPANSLARHRRVEGRLSIPIEQNGLDVPVRPPLSSFTDPSPASMEAFRTAMIGRFSDAETATAQAHAAFLEFSSNLSDSLAQALTRQIELEKIASESGVVVSALSGTFPLEKPQFGGSLANEKLREEQEQPVAVHVQEELRTTAESAPKAPRSLDRTACLEFGRGRVGDVLGQAFAEADSFPTRVRLPDEPLMLVDRILEIHGTPLSMTHGRVVTEHDIHAGAWYLDCDRIPTCIAVEAGQADLFLSGYLGIDFQTRGRSVYRLLDARVCFHRNLPGPGNVIRYDIRIERFFRQSDTWLFKFSFEATVDGMPFLSMTEGCAGFFSAAELAGGRGIVRTSLDLKPIAGKRASDWEEFVEIKSEHYSSNQLDLLRQGDLAGCFGAPFDRLTLKKPITIPSGLMTLIQSISRLDPKGGRFGLGLIRGEAVIRPDDWFLKCHFVDDQVMPGTLMFECCLHTLRVFLLRLGWVSEEGQITLEPVPGIASQLKCRGQVTAASRTVTYEVSIKEIGYRPEPFVIADALMYADGKPIVEISNMSLRYVGATIETFRSLWATAAQPPRKRAIFDSDRILAFAIGKPSEAFGENYRIFDNDRVIARLPGPPYQFLDRVTEIRAEPWKIEPGAEIETQYDIPADAWYFEENRQRDMPFAVLLEIALQPCGWLAGYMGSALTSEEDLSFRNLGGTATQFENITAETGTLTVRVKLTRASSSAGMIIQFFDYSVTSRQGMVYKGDTYFGFFPKTALQKQEGLKDATRYVPSAEEQSGGKMLNFPAASPFPGKRLRLLDRIECWVEKGGPKGLGYIRATRLVRPEEWFFKAHFYQDPVVPGSLGLESFLQLLKFAAKERWGGDASQRFEAVALAKRHEWVYRGQVVPSNKLVTVEAIVTEVDDNQRLLRADGYLSVDGRLIYGMKDFTLRMRCC